VTTEPGSLSDWLLEQIREDERRASVEQRYFCASGAPSAWWPPARVLSECATKRLVVRACAPCMIEVTVPGRPREFLRGEGPPWGEEVLKIMALPYADRPGYREEWRP
jgi:hypothetical protein